MRRWWVNWGRFIALGLLLGLSCFHLIHSPQNQAYATTIITETISDLYSTHQSDQKVKTVAKLPSCSLLPAPCSPLLPTHQVASQPALPPQQAHPLPPSLANWEDSTHAGDYFAEVKPSPVGYLVWSHFPVRVFLEQPLTPLEESASNHRWNVWVEAVIQAVNEWGEYLPLEVVTEEETADIVIARSRPPLEATLNPETGQFQIPRAQTAQTRYQFYLDSQQENSPILSHRFTIHLSPNQSPTQTLGTARHEIGHALGIWGHSPEITDALYFSQVSNPSFISPRDINTLKKVYEQPTQLGWHLE